MKGSVVLNLCILLISCSNENEFCTIFNDSDSIVVPNSKFYIEINYTNQHVNKLPPANILKINVNVDGCIVYNKNYSPKNVSDIFLSHLLGCSFNNVYDVAYIIDIDDKLGDKVSYRFLESILMGYKEAYISFYDILAKKQFGKKFTDLSYVNKKQIRDNYPFNQSAELLIVILKNQSKLP